MDNTKKIIAKIGVVFVGVLLFLTFFSNTVYNFNLPGVTVEFAKEGVLTYSAEGRGVVEYADKVTYFAQESGRVTVLVSEGEKVRDEDALYEISADMESLRQNIDRLELDAERIELRLEKARADMAFARQNLSNYGTDLTEETVITEFDSSEFDYEIERLGAAIETARKELEDAEFLYELGEIARNEVDDRKAAVGFLETQLHQEQERKQRAESDFERAAEASRRAEELGLRAVEDGRKVLERAVSDAEHYVREQVMELEANRRERDRVREQIESGGVLTVLADNAGVVLGVRTETGLYINRNEPVVTIGVAEGGFKAEIDLPESVDYISVDDQVMCVVRSKNIFDLRGTVGKLKLEHGRLVVEIQLRNGKLEGGETVELGVSETSRVHNYLLPNSAVRRDSPGEYYVLYAEMVEGTFRNEYFARRMPVEIIAYDNFNTAVGMQMRDEPLPIIVNSDRVVSVGDKVRLVGAVELGVRS